MGVLIAPVPVYCCSVLFVLMSISVLSSTRKVKGMQRS